jgi:hypothetical protein
MTYIERQHTVPPERSDLVLSSDIPHGEGNVLVLDSLNVESCSGVKRFRVLGKWAWLTDGWDGSYNLAQLKLI